jgi:hypothetical protein
VSVYGSVARALKPPQHAATRRPLLRLVPATRPGRPLAPFVVLLLGLLVGGLMGLLLLNTWTAQDAFRLHALQSQQGQLDDTEQALRQQVDDATDPSVLAERAHALGMVPGDPLPRFVRPNGRLIGASGRVTGTTQGDLLIVQGPVPPSAAPPSSAATPSTSASAVPSAQPSSAAAGPSAHAGATTKASAAKGAATHTTTAGTRSTHTAASAHPSATAKPSRKRTRP